MLSDEEKKAIEYYNNKEYTFGFEVDMDMEQFKKAIGIEETEEDTFEKHQMRFKTLINLIEKQSKEIEELKEKNNKLMEELDLTTVYISGVYDGQKKVEDKIKAKIEECREILYSFEKELELKANKDKFIHKESMNCLLGQISILQALLEKE